MNQQLAALLKAYEAFREAPPERADHFGDIYEFALQEYSRQSGIALEMLDRAVKIRFLRQVRGESKQPSSIPPKA